MPNVEQDPLFDCLIVTGPNGRTRRVPMKVLEGRKPRVKRGRGGRRKRARLAALEARRAALRTRAEALAVKVARSLELLRAELELPTPTAWAERSGAEVLAELLEAAERIRNLPPAPIRVLMSKGTIASALSKHPAPIGEERRWASWTGIPYHVCSEVPDGEARVVYSDGHVERVKV